MVKCEYCGAEYTEEEVFEDENITCIPEYFYCGEWCYNRDGGDFDDSN
jgi:hypothetical protein